MTEGRCAGCGMEAPGVICCDPCWARVPTNLPGHPRWRSRLRALRAINDWDGIEDVINDVRAWLAAHQKAAPGGSR